MRFPLELRLGAPQGAPVRDVRLDEFGGNVVGVARTAPVTVTSATTGSDGAVLEYDFACAFKVAIASDDDRSAEQWARAAWEKAPTPFRWFMLFGWRSVLQLRLGPLHSPDHVLGWRIVENKPGKTTCEASSGFLKASNTFLIVDETFVWSTFVCYEAVAGRVIWSVVAPLHRLLARAALRRAAGR